MELLKDFVDIELDIVLGFLDIIETEMLKQTLSMVNTSKKKKSMSIFT